jgi:hypothetical protein
MKDVFILWLLVGAIAFISAAALGYRHRLNRVADDDGLNFDDEALSDDLMKGVRDINFEAHK